MLSKNEDGSSFFAHQKYRNVEEMMNHALLRMRQATTILFYIPTKNLQYILLNNTTYKNTIPYYYNNTIWSEKLRLPHGYK